MLFKWKIDVVYQWDENKRRSMSRRDVSQLGVLYFRSNNLFICRWFYSLKDNSFLRKCFGCTKLLKVSNYFHEVNQAVFPRVHLSCWGGFSSNLDNSFNQFRVDKRAVFPSNTFSLKHRHTCAVHFIHSWEFNSKSKAKHCADLCWVKVSNR